jgi:hypothetical protein
MPMRDALVSQYQYSKDSRENCLFLRRPKGGVWFQRLYGDSDTDKVHNAEYKLVDHRLSSNRV